MLKRLIAHFKRPKCKPKHCGNCIYADTHWENDIIFRGFSCRVNTR